ncbi:MULTISPECIES: hypothetical protein [Streptomyces]|uniref:Uncharacterized protein n=1 Tax=Streptomyces fradiae ATCC 10745 = DSM 40063 TaxID=1319510 RepID=A0A1Y2NSW2_STRFR|nr:MULTISPECIES: hypothetical protein [Streptomyces]OSY50420.1 hypothetical protein BG846_03996 [Streptomyces fradiae ATCC 10745 = DSM 40063]QEV11657.1 hypothetical protein CP974_06105 [Streptomyces fradiae ATCC 10745 = DSM 40063]QEV12043.1 hypothetical protein CP974_08445 [Streptomyces fradiae ATCC 10745 = DSM 40063]
MAADWWGRLDVVEALEENGWIGDADMPLSILRHPSGAVWAVVGGTDDSGLDCPGGAVIQFPSDVPSAVIIAACLAAARTAEPPR